MVFWRSLFVGLLVLFVLPAQAGAPRRIALVIGNGAYTAVPALPNPPSDADDVGQALRDVGFDTVTVAKNLTLPQLYAALRDFAVASQDVDWAVIYYAGHGIEVEGKNYLVPVDAHLAVDTDVSFEAVPMQAILTAVSGATKLRLIIMDACRDNPFLTRMRRLAAERSLSRGLARTNPSDANLFIVYSAQSGETASDGTNGRSPFVTALLRNIRVPGLEINLMFRRVRADVLEATNRRQEPALEGNLPGEELFFKAPLRADPNEADGLEAANRRKEPEWEGNLSSGEPVAAPVLARPGGATQSLPPSPQEPERAAASPPVPGPGPKPAGEAVPAPAKDVAASAPLPPNPQADRLAIARLPDPVAQTADAGDVARSTEPVKAIPAPTPTIPGTAVPPPGHPASVPPSEPRPHADIAKGDDVKIVPPPEGGDPDLVAAVQKELRRVGCDPGGVEGTWTVQSGIALFQFERVVGVELDADHPDKAALDALRHRRARACPAPGSTAKAGTSSPKPLPRVRVAKRPEEPPAPAKPASRRRALPEHVQLAPVFRVPVRPAARASARGGAGCFVFNGDRAC